MIARCSVRPSIVRTANVEDVCLCHVGLFEGISAFVSRNMPAQVVDQHTAVEEIF